MTIYVHMLPASADLGTDHTPFANRLAPETIFTEGTEIQNANQVEVLVGGFVSAEQIGACPKLRAVIVPFAGVPAETQALLRERPNIDLHNLHYNVVPTAEMALALLLAAAKAIVPLDRDLRANDWSSRFEPETGTRLDGKNAVILGYGQIGKRIARGCHGLGMKTIGVRRSVAHVQMEEGVPVYPVTALDSLLPKADALILVLPGTPETEGMIGASQIALLPTDAIIVNVGRGPTIDEEALYNALRDKRIRAAGIDVWWKYPERGGDAKNSPPSNYPFNELPNVVMSPHRGGWLLAAEEDRFDALEVLIRAAARGEAIPNKVDKVLGY